MRNHLENLSGGKSSWHTAVSAFFGGAASAATLPLDNIIANMQKSDSKGGVVEVSRKILAERGVKVQGQVMQMLSNSLTGVLQWIRWACHAFWLSHNVCCWWRNNNLRVAAGSQIMKSQLYVTWLFIRAIREV